MSLFGSSDLHTDLSKALKKMEFIKPTPIQEAAMPVLLRGQDLLACAETGSGKTGAYAVPIVQYLLNEREACACILVPTRELAHQVADFFKQLLFFQQKIQGVLLIGGEDIRRQTQRLRRSPRIIVATPGRLIDHLKRQNLSLKNLSHLILDEGDRMLDMGFLPQLDEILKFVPNERVSGLFTATWPKVMDKLSSAYLKKPQRVQIGPVSKPVRAIDQKGMVVDLKEKNKVILDELNTRQGSIIVFAKTRARTEALTRYLRDFGFAVEQIHGDRTQGQRNKAIQKFRSGQSRILCATDIAARGLDIPSVRHVINYDLPMSPDDYVHRIGRTARNGAKGEALSFITPADSTIWRVLQRRYKIGGEVGMAARTKKVARSPQRRTRRRFSAQGNCSH